MKRIAILAADRAARRRRRLQLSSEQATPKELNLFAWSEYVPQAVIDGFTKETGIKVNYETYASNEEMLAKLVSGAQRYDLIQPSEYTIEALIKEKRLEADRLVEGAEHQEHRRRSTRTCRTIRSSSTPCRGWPARSASSSTPTRSRTTIKGYKDVFQEKYKGRIVVLDDPREIVSWALATHRQGPERRHAGEPRARSSRSSRSGCRW